MPYDPYAPTQAERSGIYTTVWIAFAASLVMLSGKLGMFGNQLADFAALIVGVHLVVVTLGNRFDEHFIRLRNFGSVCAVAVIGLWLTVLGLARVFNVSHGAGHAVTAGGHPVTDALRLPLGFDHASLVLGFASVAFYAGFAVAYWRSNR
ncbi:hypothetical protein J4558_10585 [Leptolyngbya sp. 15MV]|nr:hypothetical protein J4558_10585 [Leptolyngbya sp. 15MV]